jgi:hypothetical protein
VWVWKLQKYDVEFQDTGEHKAHFGAGALFAGDRLAHGNKFPLILPIV